MRSWKPHGAKVQALAFSPDGRTLATAGGSSQFVTLWDCLALSETKRFGGTGDRIHAFEFTANGEYLAALDQKGAVRIWATDSDGTTPVAEMYITGNDVAPARVLAFSPTTGRLVVASALVVNWWDTPTEPKKTRGKPSGSYSLGVRPQEIHALKYTPDGSRVLVGRDDLELWDDSMRGPVTTIRTNKGGGLRAITISSDGVRAAFRLKNTVRVYRFGATTWEKTLHWGSDPVYAVSFSRDGRTLLTAGADGTVRFWDVGTWQETRQFDWGIGKIHLVAFAPDGLTCAAAGEGGRVVIWDADV